MRIPLETVTSNTRYGPQSAPLDIQTSLFGPALEAEASAFASLHSDLDTTHAGRQFHADLDASQLKNHSLCILQLRTAGAAGQRPVSCNREATTGWP